MWHGHMGEGMAREGLVAGGALLLSGEYTTSDGNRLSLITVMKDRLSNLLLPQPYATHLEIAL